MPNNDAPTLDLKKIVRDIPDFPKKGILFKDITPILQDPAAFRQGVDVMYEVLKDKKIDYVVGVESRGFIFSPTLAYKLGAGFVPVRKKGKLPHRTFEMGYELEYGNAILEIHEDALPKGARVAVVDDLLATGGTALATTQLVEISGAKVEKIVFLIELLFLNGRDKLKGHDVFSVIQY